MSVCLERQGDPICFLSVKMHTQSKRNTIIRKVGVLVVGFPQAALKRGHKCVATALMLTIIHAFFLL